MISNPDDKMTLSYQKHNQKISLKFYKLGISMALENKRQEIFSNERCDGIEFDLRLKSESISYNPYPVFLTFDLFLGTTFHRCLCFNKHFENLCTLVLCHLNFTKIFSDKSWH